MSCLLTRYDYDNVVRQQKFGRGKLESSSIARCNIDICSRRHQVTTQHQVPWARFLASAGAPFVHTHHVRALSIVSWFAAQHANAGTRHSVTLREYRTSLIQPPGFSAAACAEIIASDWTIRGSCAAQSQVDMQLQGKLVKLLWSLRAPW
jgi:hypothetical protein